MFSTSVTRTSLLIRSHDPQDRLAWGQFVRLYAPLIHAYGMRRGLQDREYRWNLFHWAAERVKTEFREATWSAFWQTVVAPRLLLEARFAFVSLGVVGHTSLLGVVMNSQSATPLARLYQDQFPHAASSCWQRTRLMLLQKKWCAIAALASDLPWGDLNRDQITAILIGLVQRGDVDGDRLALASIADGTSNTLLSVTHDAQLEQWASTFDAPERQSQIIAILIGLFRPQEKAVV